MRFQLLILASLGLLIGVSLGSDKPSSKLAPPAVKATTPVVEGIGPGKKLIFAIARARAAGELAKKEGISRSAAREKIDSIDDSTLDGLVKEAKLVVKERPVGGPLVDWLIENQEIIKIIVAILLALFS
jgi:hypothetical protein